MMAIGEVDARTVLQASVHPKIGVILGLIIAANAGRL